ncbi:hypothetical protein MUK42_12988 [Musa troglodytarum]|uniref:Uncharacterized protein n=1 Tax=Musa troglodytarum TaxID=320322 RepID=A0A9E7HRX2_9LILI|nr:hypothetical protein MUK42_12988 [Musa troglodytarum]
MEMRRGLFVSEDGRRRRRHLVEALCDKERVKELVLDYQLLQRTIHEVGGLGFVIEKVMELADLQAINGSWSHLLSVKHWQSRKASSMLGKGPRINHMRQNIGLTQRATVRIFRFFLEGRLSFRFTLHFG